MNVRKSDVRSIYVCFQGSGPVILDIVRFSLLCLHGPLNIQPLDLMNKTLVIFFSTFLVLFDRTRLVPREFRLFYLRIKYDFSI